MTEQQLSLDPVHECEFFGHEWEPENYQISDYTLYWCRWCSKKKWRKEDD